MKQLNKQTKKKSYDFYFTWQVTNIKPITQSIGTKKP